MPGTPTPAPAKKATPFDNHFQGKVLNTIEDEDFRVEVYADKAVKIDKRTGQVVATKPLNSQFSSPQQRAAVIGNDQAVLPSQNFGAYGRQKGLGNGLYGEGAGFDWQDFQRRHGSWLDGEYPGGNAQFIQDVQNPQTSKEKTRWFQQRVNEKFKERGYDPYFLQDGNKNSNQLDGLFGNTTFSVPGFTEPSAIASTATGGATATTAPTAPGSLKPDKAKPFDKGWWQQDIVNLTAAVTDHVNQYKPLLQQERLVSPDYALLDPSRQIAASQEQFNEFRQTAENTSSGQVARANVLGAAGQQGARVADIIGQNENQNIGISNAAQGAWAETRNRETDVNTRLLDKYVTESAVANQNYDNALRARKGRIVDALNQGTTNAQKQTQLEDIFPQVHVDRNSGHIEFSGNGKDIQDDADAFGTQNPDILLQQQGAYYQKAYQMGLSQGMDQDNAHKFAQHQLGMYQPTDAKSKQAAARQMYQQRPYHLGGEILPFELPTIGF